MTHRGLLLALTLVALPALAEDTLPAAASPAPVPAAREPDPWEGFNRSIFSFNDRVDRYALKPVAKGYRKVTPRPVRMGVTNFFRNLRMPVVLLNDLLQGKPRAAGADLSRLLVNSTLGFVGLVDAATVLGIPRNDEDFGQTLGAWGVPNGPYLVLPFLGPSTVRDGAGLGVDVVSDPVTLEAEVAVTASLWAAKVVNMRANLLDVEEIIQGDRYLFMRDLYLQSREFAVKDGQVESDPFLDDEAFEDEAAPGEGEGAPLEEGSGTGGAGDAGEPASGDPVQDGPATAAGASAIDNSR